MKTVFPNVHTLRAQIMLGFAILVILTALAVGLSALWMNYTRLKQEACNQAVQIVRNSYSMKVKEVEGKAIVVSMQPALIQWIEEKNPDDLKVYLINLQEGMPEVDWLAVCDTQKQIIASTIDPPFADSCNSKINLPYAVIDKGHTSEVWLLSSKTILDRNTVRGKVLLGILLDHQFLHEIQEQSGLDHTLMVNDRGIASSLGKKDTTATHINCLPGRSPGNLLLKPFQSGQGVYDAGRFPLNDTGLMVEVSPEATAIKIVQRQQITFLMVIIFIIVMFAILFGAFLAQRIHRPLRQLAVVAAKFRMENLDEPLKIDTQVSEVKELAQALENSRISLKEALISLQNEKKWGELLLESIVEGIVILDNSGHISYFSPGAERITGWQRQEVVHKPIDAILKPADPTVTFLSQIPPLGEKHRVSVVLKGGKKSILSVTHAELPFYAAGKSTMVLVFRDVSEEEALSHLLSHFMANITHEFRTPLSALAASIELLLREADHLSKSELKELLDSLHLGILNLENLIDNLLEGSSIETGRFRVKARPASLQEVIHTAAETISPLLKKYGQQLTIELPDDLPPVLIDERRIVQVLINLLSNASKYGPNDAEIKLSSQAQPGWVEVSVSDRGPGIPKEYQKDLFSGFILTRIEDGLMKKGAGLGLSVANAIIKAHGGEVGVRDNVDGGAVFWFTVPMAGEK